MTDFNGEMSSHLKKNQNFPLLPTSEEIWFTSVSFVYILKYGLYVKLDYNDGCGGHYNGASITIVVYAIDSQDPTE